MPVIHLLISSKSIKMKKTIKNIIFLFVMLLSTSIVAQNIEKINLEINNLNIINNLNTDNNLSKSLFNKLVKNNKFKNKLLKEIKFENKKKDEDNVSKVNSENNSEIFNYIISNKYALKEYNNLIKDFTEEKDKVSKKYKVPKKDKVKEPKQEDFLRLDLDKQKDPKSYKGNDSGNQK